MTSCGVEANRRVQDSEQKSQTKTANHDCIHSPRCLAGAVALDVGHDIEAIVDVLSPEACVPGKPTCVVAHTNKGRGISFMQDLVEWHHKVPNREQYEQARQMNPQTPPPPGLYMALLAYPLNSEQVEQMGTRLKLPGPTAQILRDTCHLKTIAGSLAAQNIKPSRIYDMLHGYSASATMATALAVDDPLVRQNIHLYLNRLRYIKPVLTGEDLKSIGIVPGPRISEILDRLQAARMDGEASNRQEEEGLVREWLQQDA